MTADTLRLPWTADDVPHAVLDILRGCNIRCRDCFNTRPAQIKPVAEIEAELDHLLRLRKLQSVSILGGEITLHPDLAEIVRAVKKRGLAAELFSNGVELDDARLAALRQAGADVIFMHIEKGQQRPDLPVDASPAAVSDLRARKAESVCRHGMEAGLAITTYPDAAADLVDAIRDVLHSPHVTYMLVTLWRDTSQIHSLTGDLRQGLAARAAPVSAAPRRDALTMGDVTGLIAKEFNLRPFAYLGARGDAGNPRWLSYLLAANGAGACLPLTMSAVEHAFLRLYRIVAGRYPFYQKQDRAKFHAQLLLNGIATGHLTRNRAFAKTAGDLLHTKRILLQSPAELSASGELIHCEACPDAVLVDGKLVPLCVSDCIKTEES
jgi:hypothetical protein